MLQNRRTFIKNSLSYSLTGLAASAGLISPELLKAAAIEPVFRETNIEDAIATISRDLKIIPSNKIRLVAPKIAENGAIVPLSIKSSLTKTQSIAVFSEKNPIPLVAQFELSPVTEPIVQARIKMAASGNIIVIIKADQNLYTTRQYVKVTVGGCGE